MIRDFDLIRKIMLDLQALPANSMPTTISYPGEYEQDVINEHMNLLIEAGLINGKVLRTMSGIAQVNSRGLTWPGHDFMDIAKKETLWARAKQIALERGLSLTVEVLTGALKEALKEAAGGLLS